MLRNSTDPNCSHSMCEFWLCCHGNVPPTPKVHNINCIIQFIISFEGNELSTCHFTSNKKSCPRTKTGVNTGNGFLVKNLILPHVRSPHPLDKSSQITHVDNLSPPLQLFLHMEWVDSYSWHFHTNQGYNFHWFEMPRESVAQTNAKFRPPDSSEVKWHKYFKHPLLLYHV